MWRPTVARPSRIALLGFLSLLIVAGVAWYWLDGGERFVGPVEGTGAKSSAEASDKASATRPVRPMADRVAAKTTAADASVRDGREDGRRSQSAGMTSGPKTAPARSDIPAPPPVAPGKPVSAPSPTTRGSGSTMAAATPQDAVARFSIAGVVVNTEGAPVAGVELVAAQHRLFNDNGADLADFDAERETVSDASGGFRFDGLANGEYELRTLESFDHPVAASLRVRAGSTAVRLPIVEQREVWVDGYVATEDNSPLAEVAVYADDAEQPIAVSDASGLFGFHLLARTDKGSRLRLSKADFQEATLDVLPRDWLPTGELVVDVGLSPLHTAIGVSGTVTDIEGRPLAAKKINLRGAGKTYETTTNPAGAFALRGIQGPGSYNLSIPASGDHGSYNRGALEVPAEGVSGLLIELETLGEGVVQGWMQDPAGEPVRNFSLIARSQHNPFRAIPVTGDDGGYFRLQSVPAGWLRIESDSEPRFVIEGIMVEGSAEVEVNPIIDLGNRSLNGVVVAADGAPIPAAAVRLSWRFKEGDVNHQSIRNTVTDADGRFGFSALGAEPHSLYVDAPGYSPRTLMQTPSGAAAVIRLDPSP